MMTYSLFPLTQSQPSLVRYLQIFETCGSVSFLAVVPSAQCYNRFRTFKLDDRRPVSFSAVLSSAQCSNRVQTFKINLRPISFLSLRCCLTNSPSLPMPPAFSAVVVCGNRQGGLPSPLLDGRIGRFA